MSTPIKLKEAARLPQITPLQLLIFVVISIYEMISALFPMLIGEDINIYFVVINLAIGYGSYFAIMAMRAVSKGDTRGIFDVVKNMIENVVDIVKDMGSNNDEKIPALERLLIWIVRELDAIYLEELGKFTEHIKAKLLPGEIIDPKIAAKEVLKEMES